MRHSNPQDTECLSRHRKPCHVCSVVTATLLCTAPLLPILVCVCRGGDEIPERPWALCTLRIRLWLSSASPWCCSAAPPPCLCSPLDLVLVISALLPTFSPALSFQVAVLTSELLYPQCSLTLLVSLVTGIFQREANRTVMSCAVLPMRDDLS